MWRRFLVWLDDRTGYSGPLSKILRYPVPEHAHRNPLFTLGGLTLALFLVQAFTGMLLALYYEPSPDGAYRSTDYIQFELPLGWLVRGVHHWTASLIVITVVLHLARTYLYGAYKAPRELTWLIGVILLLVTVSFSFTGYLLPWDQTAYWATKVGTEIAGSVPVFGTILLRLMRGGAEMGQATLTRFYASHILILPGVLVLMLAAHLILMRRHGLVGPLREQVVAGGQGGKQPGKTVPFYPDHLLHEATMTLVMIFLLILAARFFPAALGAEADPTDTSVVPRPEWYFLFYFQLLTYFPGWLERVATVLIPLLFFGSLLLLPFLDTGSERRPWKKPITTGAFVFYTLAVLGLTTLALLR